MKIDNKLDIFEVLKNIDNGNIYYYDSLSDNEKKQLSMVVLFRWMTGTENTQQLKALDSIVNPFLYNLANHKDLIYKLMVIASSGTEKRYKWNPFKKVKDKLLTNKVISEYYGLSMSAARSYITMFDNETIIDMAKELGYDDTELKKIKKEND